MSCWSCWDPASVLRLAVDMSAGPAVCLHLVLLEREAATLQTTIPFAARQPGRCGATPAQPSQPAERKSKTAEHLWLPFLRGERMEPSSLSNHIHIVEKRT